MDTRQWKISMPQAVCRIIDTLEANGYEAYAVGGCVRDACLGREPHDWDMTTNASPLEVKALFPRTVDTGIAHGTVTVMMGKNGYEVTTYRIDGTYEDARHPSSVTFTPELREDLRRRDFTINAMAYNERCGLVDLFGGQEDLSNGVVRCVGVPEERFGEDALRIMRAVRFAAQLGFQIETQTARAAALLAPSLCRISAERVREELMKILVSDRPQYIKTAWELGITAVWLPEFDAMMKQPQDEKNGAVSVGEHTLLTLPAIEADPVLRLTMLLHDMGKCICAQRDDRGVWHFPDHAACSARLAAQITRRLKFDRDTMRRTRILTGMHTRMPEADAASVRKMAGEAGADVFADYLKVKRADILVRQDRASREERLAALDAVCRIWDKVQADHDPLTVGELAVTGTDLMAAGFSPGPALGRLLHALLDEVLRDPSLNSREQLLKLAGELFLAMQDSQTL